MDYSASGGIGKKGLSIVDSEAGRKSNSSLHKIFIMCQYINIIRLMRAEPITMGSSLKPDSWCKVCVRSSIIISKKPSSLTSGVKVETIHWQTRLDDAFHERRALKKEKTKQKNKQEGMGEKSDHFMNICCCISISYSWSTCLYRSEFCVKDIKYTRLHREDVICWFLNSTFRAQDMNGMMGEMETRGT